MTPRQRELLDYLGDYIKQRGFSPSYDEMRNAMGFKSKSSIHRMLIGLKASGHVRSRPGAMRSIEIVTAPSANLPPVLELALDSYCRETHTTRDVVIRDALAAYLTGSLR